MATEKVTVTVPEDLLAEAKAAVDEKRVANVSAYVTVAMAAKAEGDRADRVLEALFAHTGQPAAEHYAWADRVLADDPPHAAAA